MIPDILDHCVMKKFLNHLRDNWIKYGLETCTILIGIFGALTIDNWNEERKDRNKEHILLLQLKEEYSINQLLLEEGFKGYDSSLWIMDLTLNHTGPDVDLPEQEILDSIRLVVFRTVELTYSTISPDLSTDRIELLQNEHLKTLLSSFPAVYTRYKRFEALSKDLVIKQRNLHQSYISILYRVVEMQKKDLAPHSSDFLGLLRDRNLQNIVVDRILVQRNAVDALEELADKNDAILNLINQELSRFD